MTMLPTVRVDMQNADPRGRVRLNTVGATEDLSGIALEDGLELQLVDAELRAIGRAVYSKDENAWVAEVDWDEVVRG
jgi:hypothetical protein